MKTIRLFLLIFVSISGFFLNASAQAEGRWKECRTVAKPKPPQTPAGLEGATRLSADDGVFREQGISELKGKIRILHDGELLLADEALYNRPKEELNAKGHVEYTNQNIHIKGSSAHLNMANDTGQVVDADFQFLREDGHGTSKTFVREGKDRARLTDAQFTTCPVGDNGWEIEADDIQLDHQEGIGRAQDVTLKMEGIPVFYTPYFRFPLDDRRVSGFLMPTIGSNGGKNGLDISLPYYFNIAPNLDATLTPRFLTQRGIMLNTEVRYLTKKHKGRVYTELLPNDDGRNGDDRRFVQWQHHGQLMPFMSLDIDINEASDADYFDDFSNTLRLSSLTALEKRVDLNINGGNWQGLVRARDFQILDGSLAPYSLLPQFGLRYQAPYKPGGVDMSIQAELTHFDRDNSVIGQRFDTKMDVQKRFGDSAWFVEPHLTLRHTQYNLDKIELDAAITGDRPSRTLPIISMDSGLFFDRSLAQGKFIQTLEPRLFYLYIPKRDQANIPIFDVAENDFSFSQMFNRNRFSGGDRVGDANQVTFALSSRLQDTATGEEKLHASIGQTHYFRNREVTLPGGVVETTDSSSLVLEVGGKVLPHTELTATTFWDTQENESEVNSILLHYKDEQDRILNLGYRYRRDELKQAEVSFATPISSKWNVVGRWSHDVENSRTLETLGGLEYESCCWKMRFVSRRYLTADNVTYDNPVFIQFQLKGLGKVGNRSTEALLEEGVFGYEVD